MSTPVSCLLSSQCCCWPEHDSRESTATLADSQSVVQWSWWALDQDVTRHCLPPSPSSTWMTGRICTAQQRFASLSSARTKIWLSQATGLRWSKHTLKCTSYTRSAHDWNRHSHVSGPFFWCAHRLCSSGGVPSPMPFSARGSMGPASHSQYSGVTA